MLIRYSKDDQKDIRGCSEGQAMLRGFQRMLRELAEDAPNVLKGCSDGPQIAFRMYSEHAQRVPRGCPDCSQMMPRMFSEDAQKVFR